MHCSYLCTADLIGQVVYVVCQNGIGGHAQVPGVIKMEVCSAEEVGHKSGVLDRTWSRLFIVFNARPTAHTGNWPGGESPAAYLV